MLFVKEFRLKAAPERIAPSFKFFPKTGVVRQRQNFYINKEYR